MVRSLSPLLTPPSLLLPTSPSLMLLPTSSINSFWLATIPGCPSDLPLLIYNSPSMVSPSRLTPKTTLSCVTSSSPPYLIVSPFLFPKPASSTLIEPPTSTIRKPWRSWYWCPRKTGSSYPTSPESLSLVATTLSREPTLRPPPNSVITAGDLAMSNLAARTLLYAPSAPALTLKQSTAAPTQPAPKEEISTQSSTAALPLPHAAPTVPKTTRQATGTAWPALNILHVVPPTPRRQRQPPLLPPASHPNPQTASCLHPIQTLWTPSQTNQDPPLPLLHPPSQVLSPPLSLLPQRPLFALRSWVPWGPPLGPVAPNPMGSQAPSPLPETSRPCTGICLTTHLLYLGAGPPHAICQSFNTTASGAGMCFFPFLILLLLLTVLLTSLAYKTPLLGAPAFLPFKITPLLPTQVGLATNPKWLSMFLLICWLRPQFYLPFLTGLMWPPSMLRSLLASGNTCSR